MLMIAIVVAVAVSQLITLSDAQCEYASGDGDYKVSWTLDKPTSEVRFKLVAKQKSPTGFWTGIGFGNGMQAGDMIILNTIGNQISISDRHAVGFAEPAVDQQQNVRLIRSSVDDGGLISAEFSRPVNTGDRQDAPLQDPAINNCQQFIFPETGGRASSVRTIGKHSATPVTKTICNLDSCVAGAAAAESSESQLSSAGPKKPSLVAGGSSVPENSADSTALNGNQDQFAAVTPSSGKSVLSGRRGPFGLTVAPTDSAGPGNDQGADPAPPVLPQRTPDRLPSRVLTAAAAADQQPQPAPSVPTTVPLVPGGSSQLPSVLATGGSTVCPIRSDHQACQRYVDSYLEAVFKTFERTDAHLQKACNLLLVHQQGLVRRECCNYLAQPQTCRQYMNPVSL